ncbi:uncharacterized protein LOC113236973 [Hyposmocoma kahamanoa]|uniref:uncharacterized protein LOC113236973 n=1 Tax=Hyposmocoma kahamanoa TaxID=1477025 RepID=UPI000E6D697C|nr:uncharacterized protein LOC113236973 [Hyposmocoma kahamanoa]
MFTKPKLTFKYISKYNNTLSKYNTFSEYNTLSKYKTIAKNLTYPQGSNTCVWKQIFSDKERENMTHGLFYVAVVSTLCAVWMWSRTNTAIYQRLSNKKSYDVLRLFFLGTLLKNLVGLASYNMDDNKFKRLPKVRFFESCKVYGILYNFFNFFELEALTFSCVERYVYTKYIVYGWPLKSFTYSIYGTFSFINAIFYAFLPMVGFGSYGYDYNCLFCTISLIELEEYRGVVHFIKTVKPVSVFYVIKMIVTLAVVQYLYNKLRRQINVKRGLLADAFFTTTVKCILVVNFIFWALPYMLRCETVLSQFINPRIVESHTDYMISWGWFMSQLAPIATAAVLLIEEWNSQNELKEVRTCVDTIHVRK